jgi:2'-5' RNA ligase
VVVGPNPGGMQRAFIALDPPAEVRGELTAWLRQARPGKGLRPVKPENLHLTLAFLGDRSEGELALVANILNEFADEAPRLAIGAPLWLPPRRPRVLAVEIRSLDGLLAPLQSGIARSLAGALGWHEPRSFRPHITVARMGRDFRLPRQPLPPTPSLEFSAERLVLYRSHLLPEGAQYEPIQAWPL